MNEPKSTDPWAPCPAGAIHNMVNDLTRQQRRQTLTRVGTASALLLVCGLSLGAWWVIATPPERGLQVPSTQVVQQLRCSEMPALLVQYVDHTLPSELEQPVIQHLAHCPFCQHKLEQMRQQEGVSFVPQNAPVLVAVRR